jgi:hypothetical protein
MSAKRLKRRPAKAPEPKPVGGAASAEAVTALGGRQGRTRP